MRHTFRAISAGIVLALSFSAPVPADSLEEAVAAYPSADYATALRVYRSLAEQGLAVAQFNLGLMYDLGHGVMQNYSESMKWYRLAADQGRDDAQINSVSGVQQAAYQASGNRINGQANPLSFAALGGRAFEVGKRAKKASCRAGSITSSSSSASSCWPSI